MADRRKCHGGVGQGEVLVNCDCAYMVKWSMHAQSQMYISLPTYTIYLGHIPLFLYVLFYVSIQKKINILTYK